MYTYTYVYIAYPTYLSILLLFSLFLVFVIMILKFLVADRVFQKPADCIFIPYGFVQRKCCCFCGNMSIVGREGPTNLVSFLCCFNVILC